MVAPFGVVAATALLVSITRPTEQDFGEFIHAAGTLVDLGAVVYATIAVLAERGIAVIWWALEQRKKYRAERIAHNERIKAMWRDEGRAEGLDEGRAEGRAEAYTAIMDAIRGEANGKWEEVVERVARERGIIPDDVPPPNGAN